MQIWTFSKTTTKLTCTFGVHNNSFLFVKTEEICNQDTAECFCKPTVQGESKFKVKKVFDQLKQMYSKEGLIDADPATTKIRHFV